MAGPVHNQLKQGCSAVLAIDLGTRRTGLARASTPLWIPTALPTIHSHRFADILVAIQSALHEYNVDGIVLGIPIETSGNEGSQAAFVRKFVRFLVPKVACPVWLVDERMTSGAVEALQRHETRQTARGRKARTGSAAGPAPDSDAGAATLILDSWLASPQLAERAVP